MAQDEAGGIAQARALVGREYGPYVAWDPVNEPMIRQWCEALDVGNPVYLDEAAAEASPHGGLVAPVTMLNAWMMRGVRNRRPPGSAQDNPLEAAAILAASGYPAVVATGCEQSYVRYLRPGDRLSARVQLEGISAEKSTALGTGYFITLRTEYADQDGAPVGSMRFTTLQYRPADKGVAAPRTNRPSPPQPGISQDTQFFWDGLKEDKLLIQRCKACGTLRHPPGPVCTACHSFDWDTVQASGRGTIHSYVVMHHPKHPAFDYPHVVGLIQLEEGTRLVAPVVGVAHDAVKIGTPVQVEFEHVEGEHRTALFRPVAG
jgi:uncharacterized OB-fold protein/acyl dehydratase